MKKLVVYFSCSGETKKVAEGIAKLIDSDIFEICPEIPYTSKDLDWQDKSSRSTIEMEDKNSRPKIKNRIDNMSEYSVIYLGFPVWWYKEPTIIDTFIEENDLTNKNVYVYVTSGGSTVAGSLKHMKEKYPNINFVSGKTLNSVNEDEIKGWLE